MTGRRATRTATLPTGPAGRQSARSASAALVSISVAAAALAVAVVAVGRRGVHPATVHPGPLGLAALGAAVGSGALLSLSLALSRTRSVAARADEAEAVRVVTSAGGRLVPLDRTRAVPILADDGRLVAQVVWSHAQGWCATAAWPYRLTGVDGQAALVAALPRSGWLRAAEDVWIHLARTR